MRLLLDKLFDDGWQGLNHDFAAIPSLHPIAALACQMTPPQQGYKGTFHVFTDGSSQRHKSAWAFVVITEVFWQGQRYFFRIGYASALVTEDLGPVTSSATDAEATAIIAGVEYILSRQLTAGYDGIDVTFHYDA